MKKIILLLLFTVSLRVSSQIDPKDYKVIYYQEVVFETEDYKMFLVKCFSREEMIKLKIRIFNKTNDFLFIKPEEIIFNVNGHNINGYGRTIIVQPAEDATRYVDAMGSNLKVESYNVELKGIYKVNSEEEIYTVPNLNLPQGSSFNAGPFSCQTKTKDIEDKESLIKFYCVYEGDKIGILDPSKCKAIMPKGAENSNVAKKEPVLIPNKGEQISFSVKFLKQPDAGSMTDGIQIKWNETFKTAQAVQLKTIKVQMKMDPEKSEKN